MGNGAKSIYSLVKMPPELSIFLPFHTTMPGNRDHTLRRKKVKFFFLLNYLLVIH